jgi:hypothetical protein
MSSRNEIIETTAGEVAAELARRGVSPSERVKVEIAPGKGDQGRRKLSEIAARMRATAAARGLTTEIFDAILAQSK